MPYTQIDDLGVGGLTGFPFFNAVENLITLASTATLSSMNYEQLRMARLEFIDDVIENSKKYRLVKRKIPKITQLNTFYYTSYDELLQRI